MADWPSDKVIELDRRLETLRKSYKETDIATLNAIKKKISFKLLKDI